MVRQITRSLMSWPPLLAQMLDDARALLEVVPEHPRVDEMQLVLAVAEHFAQPRVVEQQPAVLVDDQQRRRTEFQHFAELTFVLGSLGSEGGTAFACLRGAGRHPASARLGRSEPSIAGGSGQRPPMPHCESLPPREAGEAVTHYTLSAG